MKIVGITYNWCVCERVREFETRMVGLSYGELKIEVLKIVEHKAQGEGDRWYYDIHYSDGSIHKIFNPNEVFYK